MTTCAAHTAGITFAMTSAICAQLAEFRNGEKQIRAVPGTTCGAIWGLIVGRICGLVWTSKECGECEFAFRLPFFCFPVKADNHSRHFVADKSISRELGNCVAFACVLHFKMCASSF